MHTYENADLYRFILCAYAKRWLSATINLTWTIHLSQFTNVYLYEVLLSSRTNGTGSNSYSSSQHMKLIEAPLLSFLNEVHSGNSQLSLSQNKMERRRSILVYGFLCLSKVRRSFLSLLWQGFQKIANTGRTKFRSVFRHEDRDLLVTP